MIAEPSVLNRRIVRAGYRPISRRLTMSTQATDVLHLDEASFKDRVIEASGVAVVDFWAEWCQPCKMLAPTIDRIAERFAGKALIAKLDIDAAQPIAVEHGISSIPTIVIFKDGKEVDRSVGIVSEDDLAAKIEAQL